VRESEASTDDTDIAYSNGFIDALQFAVDQVEARAKKAAA
jgi:hypothetical protein